MAERAQKLQEYENVGDVQVEQGHLAGALKSSNDSLAIADRLAKSDPGNAKWEGDLSVSYGKLASALKKSGKRGKAVDALRQGQTRRMPGGRMTSPVVRTADRGV